MNGHFALVICAIFAVLSACAVPVHMGDSPVHGTVRDARTNMPIPAAVVVASYSSISVVGEHRYEQGSVVTGAAGEFQIPAKPHLGIQSVERSLGPAVYVVHACYGFLGTMDLNGNGSPYHIKMVRLSEDPNKGRVFRPSYCQGVSEDTCFKLRQELERKCEK
jgi:hypothetical protein